MAAENSEEHDIANVQDVENVENVGNVENAENETVESIENVENVENAENIENIQYMENMENVPENSHPAEETQGIDTNSGHKEENKWPGWPGENIFRMLVPVQKVGGIIGRKGEYIKKTCEETKARIKILDGPPGTTERTVFAVRHPFNHKVVSK